MDLPRLRSYSALKAHFPEKALRQVAEYVIRNKSKVSPLFQERLEAVLNDVVVPGFRDPKKAPAGVQAAAIAHAFQDLHAWAVLGAWMELRSDLRQKVREFLAKREVTIYKPDELPPGLRSQWREDELKTLAVEFGNTHKDFESDEVELMLCCLSGRAPATGEEPKLLAIL
jgi:hypothetical protein